MRASEKLLIAFIGQPSREREMRRNPAAARGAAAAIAIGLGWLAGCAGAPLPNTAPAVFESSPGASPGPLLWRATSPHPGAGEITLFGSVHLGRPDAVDFGSEVEAAFAAAEELVVEVDLSALTTEDILQQALAMMLLPEGETLRERLSETTWELLLAALGGEAAPELAPMLRLKPWAVTTFLAVQQFAAGGLEEQYGVDKNFLGRAAGELPIRGLETIDGQLAVLDGLAPEIQDLMLRDTLRRGGEDSGELVRAWERGDEARLTRIIFGPLDEYPEYAPFYEALFFERNEKMAARLAEHAVDGKRRFVVLGAAHMLGARGIPALLRARGFRVERLAGR